MNMNMNTFYNKDEYHGHDNYKYEYEECEILPLNDNNIDDGDNGHGDNGVIKIRTR